MNGKVVWGVLGVVGGGLASQIVPIVTILTDKTPQEIADKWNVWWPVISYGLPFLFAILGVIAVVALTAFAYRSGKEDGILSSRLDYFNTCGGTYHIGSTSSDPAPWAKLASADPVQKPPPVEDEAVRAPLEALNAKPTLPRREQRMDDHKQLVTKPVPKQPANPWVSPSGVDLQELRYSIKEVMTALMEVGSCRDEVVKRNLRILEGQHPAWHVDAPYNLRTKFVKAARDAHAARTENGNSALWITGDYPPDIRERHVQPLKNLGDLLMSELQKLPRTVVL